MGYHTIVIAPTTAKHNNKYVPLNVEQLLAIDSVLARANSLDYEALYTPMSNMAEKHVDDYAFENRIRIKQYPSYWFDPTKENNIAKDAGFRAVEHLMRDAKQAAYNTEHIVVLLAFGDDTDAHVKHAVEFANKQNTKAQEKGDNKVALIRVNRYPWPKSVVPTAQATVAENTIPF
jgi:hypothetical protein